MNTCADCESWFIPGYVPQYRKDVCTKVQVGQCSREHGFPGFPTLTWADFSCPYFKPRADWAEKAAERIWDESWGNEGPQKAKQEMARFIREEAAKAGVK